MFFYSVSSQTISLTECLEKSKVNYPLHKSIDLINKNTELKLQQLKTNYLPVFDLSGSVTWQNDVPHFNSPSPSFPIPKAPKDQYKIYVDVKQMIFDGGITKASKEVEKISGIADTKATEVDLYAIRDKIISSYYFILVVKKQIKQIDLAIEQLQKRIDEISAAAENGVILASNIDVFKVEILKLKQQKTGMQEAENTAFGILNELVGDRIPQSAEFTVPDVLLSKQDSLITRPEIDLFDVQKQKVDAVINLQTKNRMPKLYGFGQLGYGNPTYNVLNDKFGEYYMVGVKLNWNIYDWKKTAKEKQILTQQKQIISSKQESFVKQIKIAENELKGNINKYQKYILSDKEILELQKSITKTSLSKLKNGTITAADYVKDLNAQLSAAIALEIHKLQLSKAKVEYVNLLGKY
jgi:outer membrane protein TolC